MLSRATLQAYQRMTPGERLKLACDLSDQAALDLLQGPPEVVARRFELLRRQNDERNRRMLEAIARTKQKS
jgi:hypothetical protein